MKRNLNLRIIDIIWILVITSLGIFIPSLLHSPWVSIIQFAITFLLLLIYVNNSGNERSKKNLIIREISNNSLEQEKMVHSQKVMLELSNSMIQVHGFEALMDTILRKAMEVTPKAKFGSVLVMNNEGMLEFKALVGFTKDLYTLRLDPKDSYQWQATGGHFKEPIIIEDLLKYTKDNLSEDTYTSMNGMGALNLKSTMSAPIILEGQYFGSINIDSEENNMFGSHDLVLMSYFANQASIAITNQRLYDKMLHFSRYDSLTNALSRHAFEDVLNNLLSKSLRQSEKVTIVMTDLNSFKTINDVYGHAVGDKILKYFATTFMEQMRQSDLFSRYGGDEFVAVFWGSDINQTSIKLKAIHKMITSHEISVEDGETNIHCSFSYGLAEFPKEGDNPKTLISLADKRMYHHKKKADQNNK